MLVKCIEQSNGDILVYLIVVLKLEEKNDVFMCSDCCTETRGRWLC